MELAGKIKNIVHSATDPDRKIVRELRRDVDKFQVSSWLGSMAASIIENGEQEDLSEEDYDHYTSLNRGMKDYAFFCTLGAYHELIGIYVALMESLIENGLIETEEEE